MTKITYLFGAGASYNALPLAKDVTNANGKLKPGLGSFLKELAVQRYYQLQPNSNSPSEDYSRIELLKENVILPLNKLGEKSQEFGTVDTFAKYLIENERWLDLEKLKLSLSKFFILEQLLLNKYDNRYLQLLTSLMEEGELRNEIYFLNWNYDFQFQLTFKKHFKNSTFGLRSYFPGHGTFNMNDGGTDINHLKLIHLNGTCGLFEGSNERIYNLIDRQVDLSNENVIDSLLNFDQKTTMYFGYEDTEPISQRAIQLAKKVCAKTDVLIIIGYSFPYFNKRIDTDIIGSICKSDKKIQIYFQDPHLDGSFLYDRFNLSSANVDIKHIPETDQFQLPY